MFTALELPRTAALCRDDVVGRRSTSGEFTCVACRPSGVSMHGISKAVCIRVSLLTNAFNSEMRGAQIWYQSAMATRGMNRLVRR